VAHRQCLYGTFLVHVPAEPPKPICLPHNQRSVRPSPSLTSTTPHIAAKVGSGVSGCPLGQRRSSGYRGGSVRVIRWPQATAGGHRWPATRLLPRRPPSRFLQVQKPGFYSGLGPTRDTSTSTQAKVAFSADQIEAVEEDAMTSICNGVNQL
jgi:hypothetical protein